MRCTEKLNGCKGDHISPPAACFISDITERISFKFSTESLDQTLSDKFNFDLYLPNISPAFYEVLIKLYWFSQKMYILVEFHSDLLLFRLLSLKGNEAYITMLSVSIPVPNTF